MKIVLIGYGKMGKAIEKIALERGHEIAFIISKSNRIEITKENLQSSDIAIEFTSPASAFQNVSSCLNAGLPVVCGSTGWQEQLPEAENLAIKNDVGFLWASNFSIGVNIFFELNKTLAALINNIGGYDVKVEETHHTEKKDAPSGTAITLAEQIIHNLSTKKKWVKEPSIHADELSVLSHRLEDVPGTHVVQYCSPVDDIEIKHSAHNRQGFALGAVIAAEFIVNKKGIYSMKDVLGL